MPTFDRNALLAARIRAGLNKEQAARVIGVSRSALHRWETGETVPGPHLVGRIAQALRVSRPLSTSPTPRTPSSRR